MATWLAKAEGAEVAADVTRSESGSLTTRPSDSARRPWAAANTSWRLSNIRKTADTT